MSYAKEGICWTLLLTFVVFVANSGDGWQGALAWTFGGFIVLAVALCRFAKWHQRRFLRIPYEQLSQHRITPRFSVPRSELTHMRTTRFSVGGDCKDDTQ